MNRPRIALHGCALLLISVSLLPAQPKMLTLEECVTVGLENSRQLHASMMKVRYAESKSSEISSALYPAVRLLAVYQKLSDVPEFRIPIPTGTVTFPVVLHNYQLRATLQQPLFTGGRLRSSAQAAYYSALASNCLLDRDRADLIYRIKAGYWGLYRARETKRLADENVRRMREHLTDVENFARQGLATENDVLKVKVQLSNATLLQSEAANGVRLARLSLNSVLGIPLETEIGIATPLTPVTKELPSTEKLVSEALAQRPDLRAADWQVKAAESGVAAARSGWMPQLFLVGNYYYARPNPRIFPAKDEFRDTWDVGISVQFDLWNNLATLHQTNAAQSAYEQSRDALQILKDAITLEVTQSVLTFQQAKERIRLSELGVEQANENYRITAEKFKSGLTSNSELLDAEVALLQAKLQLTNSLVEYELAEAEVERASGEAR